MFFINFLKEFFRNKYRGEIKWIQLLFEMLKNVKIEKLETWGYSSSYVAVVIMMEQ